MIILEDGFQIEGAIDNSIVKLNNEWTKIIIIKTNLSIQEAENLLKNNRKFIYGDMVYMADRYIKTMVENNITYTWLKFKFRYVKENQIALIDKLIEDNLNMQIQIDTLIEDSLAL